MFATILVIDTPATCDQIRAQLEPEQYHVLSATDSARGRETAINQQPDLILLNVMTAGIHGYDICKQLKSDQRTSLIPIIIITKLRDVMFRIKGIAAGADEFLSSPHNREELLVRARNLIHLKWERERLEIERSRLKLLFDVSRAVAQQIELDSLLETVMRHTQYALKATQAILIVTDKQGRPERTIRWLPPDQVEQNNQPDSTIMQTGFTQWIWENQFGDIINEVAQDSRWVAHDQFITAGSAIGVPLIHGLDHLYGVFIFMHDAPNYFDANHLTLLTMITTQVTSAFRNANLYRAAEAQRQRLAAILASTSDAIITTDAQGEIEQFNSAAVTLFGTAAEQVIGQSLANTPTFNDITPLHTVSSNDATTHHASDVTLADRRVLHVSASPIAQSGTVAIIQDVTEQRRREQARFNNLRDVFGSYIDASLMGHALENMQQRYFSAVLFADLRNHTRLVVAHEPDVVIDHLNQFFEEMTRIIYEFDGTIIDLIGDELEVAFNIPEPQEDMFDRAVQTAIAMQERFRILRSTWKTGSDIELGLGIGIDAGDVIIGQVGSESRKNLALVGQAVNTAHRMVDLAQDSQIVVSDRFYANLSTPPIPFHSLGERPIKGLKKPMQIFRAIVPDKPDV